MNELKKEEDFRKVMQNYVLAISYQNLENTEKNGLKLLGLYNHELEVNKVLREFITKHIDIIEKELDKDGWCSLKVDIETLQNFKQILKEVV